MKNQHLKNIIELNVAVMLVSTSGVFGRAITLPAGLTIWWRCLFAAIFIGIYCWHKKYSFKIETKRDRNNLLTSGLFLGIHWVTYFYSLQLSNVAIGMLSLFTYPVITALLEPLFFRIKLNKTQLLLGAMVLVGIYFLTPEMDISNNHTKGVIWGVISAVFYSLRNIITKKNLSHYNGSKVMFYQLLVILALLWPIFFEFKQIPGNDDWLKLVGLSLITTAIGHSMFVGVFKNFNITTVSIMSSIGPIYGIIFGLLFLNEIPASKTIIGGILIISTVVIEGMLSKKKN